MNSKELIKLLKKAGWKKVRQKGSHVVFTHEKIKNPPIIVVPDHGSKDLGKGLVNDVMKKAGIKKKK